jgi:hypothetical protein
VLAVVRVRASEMDPAFVVMTNRFASAIVACVAARSNRRLFVPGACAAPLHQWNPISRFAGTTKRCDPQKLRVRVIAAVIACACRGALRFE